MNLSVCTDGSSFANLGMISYPFSKLVLRNNNLFAQPNIWESALVNIDKDAIPELLYSGEGYINTHLCWINNNKVVHQFVSNENFLYYEKNNLFYGFYFNHGVAHEMVYTLENNNLKKLFENTRDASKEKTRYLIGEKVVSEAEYKKSADKYFDKNKAATVNYCNGKNEIIKLIENYR